MKRTNFHGLAKEDLLKMLEQVGGINVDMKDMEREIQPLLKMIGREGMSAADFFSILRISAPVAFDVWLDFLVSHLGWEIEQALEDPDFLEPFAIAKTSQGTKVDLYAISAAYTPGDEKDTLVKDLMRDIANMADPAILFFKTPMVKLVNGRWFGYYGKVLNEGVWSDFVLSPNIKGLDTVFEQARARSSVESPDAKFEDRNAEFARSISCYLSGYDLSKTNGVDLVEMAAPSGWVQFLFPSLMAPDREG